MEKQFSIIIPAHNEEATLSLCIASLLRQSYPHFEIIIVNDGSTDGTAEIISEYEEKDTRIRGISLPTSSHSPGAKVIKTFEQGLKSITPKDIICKFDADIIFPPNYLEEISHCFKENPQLGMASGLVYIPTQRPKLSPELLNFSSQDGWAFEDISSPQHVRGPIKAYQKECLTSMGGLRAVLGWDNIDVMLAQKHGFQIQTLPHLWVKHLRPTAHLYHHEKYTKLGQYFKNIGLNFPLAALSSAKVALKDKLPSAWLIIMSNFLKSPHPTHLSKAEISFIRHLRWKMFLKKLRRK